MNIKNLFRERLHPFICSRAIHNIVLICSLYCMERHYLLYFVFYLRALWIIHVFGEISTDLLSGTWLLCLILSNIWYLWYVILPDKAIRFYILVWARLSCISVWDLISVISRIICTICRRIIYSSLYKIAVVEHLRSVVSDVWH